MKRVRLKRNFRFNKWVLFVCFGLLFLFVFVFIFVFVNKKVSPIIMTYAQMEAKKLSNIVINKAISKHITENISDDDLFEITKDSNGEIRTIDFNTSLVNKFLTETTNSIQMNLRNIEKGDIDAVEFSDSVLTTYDKEDLENGIIYEVSSGVIVGNPLLANVGPKIPVKISLIGDAISNVSAEVKDYGINSALIQVYVNFKISERVMLPFYDEEIIIESKAPVVLKVVTGTVPKYYLSGLSQDSPSVVIPTEENE